MPEFFSVHTKKKGPMTQNKLFAEWHNLWDVLLFILNGYSQVPNKRVYSFIPNKKVGLLF